MKNEADSLPVCANTNGWTTAELRFDAVCRADLYIVGVVVGPGGFMFFFYYAIAHALLKGFKFRLISIIMLDLFERRKI